MNSPEPGNLLLLVSSIGGHWLPGQSLPAGCRGPRTYKGASLVSSPGAWRTKPCRFSFLVHLDKAIVVKLVMDSVQITWKCLAATNSGRLEIYPEQGQVGI